MKQPCNQCPFRKNSLPGYLGEGTYNPELFLSTMEHSPIPCHITMDWENPDFELTEEMIYDSPCVGSLQFMKNSCKIPRSIGYRKLAEPFQKNDEVFNWKKEFIEHHSKR